MSFHSSPFFPEPFFPSGHCTCHSRRQRLLSFWITVSPLLHRAWNQGLGGGRGPWSESIALFAVLENLRGPSEGGRGGSGSSSADTLIPQPFRVLECLHSQGQALRKSKRRSPLRVAGSPAFQACGGTALPAPPPGPPSHG